MLLVVCPLDVSPEVSHLLFSSSMGILLMHLEPLFGLSAHREVRCIRKKSVLLVLGGNILRCSQRWMSWVDTEEWG